MLPEFRFLRKSKNCNERKATKRMEIDHSAVAFLHPFSVGGKSYGK
jgi:hypothetical protein